MAPYPVKRHEDLSEGKSYVDSFDGKPQREGQLTGNEGISPLLWLRVFGPKCK